MPLSSPPDPTTPPGGREADTPPIAPETRTLFDRVLARFPGGIIAGGAVRDARLGLPIKDIDVWVGLDDRPFIPEAPEAAEDYDAEEQIVAATVTLHEPWCPYPLHVMLTSGGGLDTDPDRVLRGFDYGLCKIAWTPNGLHLTPDYERDEQARRLSLVNGGQTTTPDRYERLRDKFAGWDVEPPSMERPPKGGRPADAIELVTPLDPAWPGR